MGFADEELVESNFHFTSEHKNVFTSLNIEFEKEYIIHRCQIDVCEPKFALDKLLTIIIHRNNTLEILNISNEKLKFHIKLCYEGTISLKKAISDCSSIYFKSADGTFSINSEHEISFTHNSTTEKEGIHIELHNENGMLIKGLKALSIGYLSIYEDEDIWEWKDVWE